jgi:nucleoside-diphosphate kinase
MMQLTDELLNAHYAHISHLPFFQRIKDSMMACPVIVCCLRGVDAVHTVHEMAGKTNGRNAATGTLRGDFCMSIQENIVHTSDTPENAEIELDRFFDVGEIFNYTINNHRFLYAENEV